MKEKYKIADGLFHIMQWYSAKEGLLGLFEIVFNVKKVVNTSWKTF